MKNTLAIVALLFISLATFVGAVYFYSKYQKTSANISDLQSENSDLDSQVSSLQDEVSTLEEAVDEAEEQLDEDLDGDDRIVDIPIQITDPCNNASSDGEILVTKPCMKETLGSKFQIQGTARVFEATFQVSIVSSRGIILYTNTFMTTGGDIGQKNPFNETITWNSPGVGTGTVNVYELSARDGSTQHLVSIPVKFQ
jgi:hypothetical protein